MLGPFLGGDSKVSRRRWLALSTLFSILALLFLLTSYLRPRRPADPGFPLPYSDTGYSKPIQVPLFTKPRDVTIVALVLFGRRNRVEILRCYLERNLVDSGGWIDEVHWVQNTVDQDDLRYLDEILASSPRYKKVDLTTEGIGFEGYAHAWDHLERGKLYVKIDDDVVWFADDAIPRIVTLKVAHTETLIVSANIINSPLMGWVHYHVGALHPYFPEFGVFERTTSPLDLTSSKKKPWRYTEYPFWEGPDDWFFDLEQDPPYDGHRWLRLKNDTDIKRTPANEIEYNTWGTGLKSWAIAAQEHYSFLENLAEDALDRYKLGRMWITDYDRLSINFMTFWADEVLDHLPMDTVDEDWLTRVLPQRIQKSVAVDSNALAAHFTFGTQHGVETTDLLARYHDYALENACRRRF